MRRSVSNIKRLLVAGGCGFIGSRFVRSMLERAEWRVINLDKLTYAGNLENLKGIVEGDHYRFVRGDIGDRTFVDELYDKERPTAVVNFAAESHVDRSILDPAPFFETNTIGVQVLLEGARKHGVERFLQVSTDEVYGDVEKMEPCDEEHRLAPSSPYAASKASADHLTLSYKRTYGLPVLIVRSCNNYGPYQFPEKLIPFMIGNVMRGEDLPLYGDGMQRREWIFVEDCVDAICRVLERGEDGEIYNISTEDEHTNLAVIDLLCKLMADEASMNVASLRNRIQFIGDRPGHDRRYATRAKKIREKLTWNPLVTFEVGLRKTIRWYLTNHEWVESVTSGAYRDYYDAVYVRAWG
ncbi:MAG TPA: dTDP-glucose 4,6-dehydratase [Nitrospirales bacterium]|nr:dTDP-glucose 4,6-dehydratase [Nitrospirales bacterium]